MNKHNKKINKDLKQLAFAPSSLILANKKPNENQMGSNLDFRHQTHVATL
ncbi:MAG: hypothetical protein ACI92T_003183 [Pseudoalteromonas distincta]|jgi:hypothetical protein